MPYYDIEKLRKMPVHFVIGTGRSGTTLLSTILNANPEVFCSPESRIVMTYYRDYHDQKSMPAQFSQDLARYSGTRMFNENRLKSKQNTMWQIEADTFLHFDTAQLSQYDYPTICKQLLLNIRLGERSNDAVRIILDKEPDHTFCVEEILSVFPNAKFLVAQRDYHAFGLSQKESQKHERKVMNRIQSGYLWNQYNQEVIRLRERYPDKIHVVQYEQLVTNTEQVIRNICTFLEIPFHESMLNPQKQVKIEKQGLNQREEKKLGDLAKPINTSRLEAWKTRLTAQEITILEAICSNTGKQFGYQATQEVSTTQKLALRLRYAPQFLLAWFTHQFLLKRYYHYPISWRTWFVKKLGFAR